MANTKQTDLSLLGGIILVFVSVYVVINWGSMGRIAKYIAAMFTIAGIGLIIAGFM